MLRIGSNLLQRWLLPSLVSVLLMASGAEAAQVRSWEFESSQNRLSFTTDEGVQPTAKLLSNPTRLVIELPGTSLGSVSGQRSSPGGNIREIRWEQTDNENARIIVELVEGYTLNPQMVQFRGISASEWMVQLPQPQAIGSSSPPAALPAQATVVSAPEPVQQQVQQQFQQQVQQQVQQTAQANPNRSIPNQPQTFVEQIEMRDNGIVLQTTGQMPQIEFKRSQDRTWMTLDIFGASLRGTTTRGRAVNREGVTISQVTQLSTTPPVVRLTFSTPNTNQNWEARPVAGGVAIWPQGGVPPAVQASSSIVTIESISLQNQSYFAVRGNGPLNYTHGWDAETGAYGITFFSARLADGVQLPQREVGGPIIWSRLRREDPDTFTVLFQPATRVQVGQVSQNSPQELAIPMGVNLASVAPPPRTPAPVTQPPINNPNPFPPPAQNRPPSSLPLPFPPPNRPSPQPPVGRNPNSRVSVVIDPGHGGSDPGAVGVGGIREKDVVISISLQVQQILEQNGVNVVMTRTDDRTIDLEPRVSLANRVGAVAFVSIHANAAYRAGATGVETFYHQTGYSLAQYIQNSILANFSLHNRGVKQARFYVLRNTTMPSALVEVGFLTNPNDARLLADPAQRTRMAQAIAQGILQYLRASGY
ncbi:N-acetylmuramoyl-L-alanine amidase [Limnospira fusiformis CCALA 023]|uniref:N-acetylmuramoyl-L-alanine amidase n=1 Tax=Arthrospira sp. PCC 8006 TaxID=1982224 RepID=UPI00396D9DA6